MNLLSGPQEYLRAAQRDSDLLRTFKAAVFQGVQMWVKPEIAGSYMAEVALAAEVVYYGLSIIGRKDLPQTLGEEYVSVSLASAPLLRPVKRVLGSTNYLRAARHFFPSAFSISLYLLLKLLLPYLIRKISTHRDKVIRNKEHKSKLDFLPSLGDLWEAVISKPHLACFFLWGGVDDIAKRIAGLVYIRHYRAESNGPSFRVLCWVVLAHAVLETLLMGRKSLAAFQAYGKRQEKREAGEEGLAGERRCGLCLEERSKPSCGPCGHIFCWDCLVAATQVKPQCPECRQKVEPTSILQLRNLS
jgi:peroxin-10